jgi:hypothetical protein
VVIRGRDAVLQANGFSKTAADADLDMMFRLQGVGSDDRRFVRHDEAFGHTSTMPAADARAAAVARQRAALRIVASWGPVATQSVGLRTLAYFLESELLTPLAQTWVVAAALGGAAAGWFSWTAVLAVLLLISFGTASVSAAALLLRGAHPDAPEHGELRALLLLAPLEVLVHRPLRAYARLAAVLGRRGTSSAI